MSTSEPLDPWTPAECRAVVRAWMETADRHATESGRFGSVRKDERNQALIAGYESGVTRVALAREYRISLGRVHEILHQYDVPARGRRAA